MLYQYITTLKTGSCYLNFPSIHLPLTTVVTIHAKSIHASFSGTDRDLVYVMHTARLTLICIFQRESNARFVRWSDGSLQLQIGNEVLDISMHDDQHDNAYLFLRHGKVLIFVPFLLCIISSVCCLRFYSIFLNLWQLFLSSLPKWVLLKITQPINFVGL